MVDVQYCTQSGGFANAGAAGHDGAAVSQTQLDRISLRWSKGLSNLRLSPLDFIIQVSDLGNWLRQEQ